MLAIVIKAMCHNFVTFIFQNDDEGNETRKRDSISYLDLMFSLTNM